MVLEWLRSSEFLFYWVPFGKQKLTRLYGQDEQIAQVFW